MAAGGPPAGPQAELPGDPFARRDPPVLAFTLLPHRSLSLRGAGVVLALLAAGLAMPLLALGGAAASWGMLPFLLAPLLALYAALRRSYSDGRLTEELRLWPDLITVERREPRGPVRRWHANPFWVRLRLLPEGRVEQYLTLTGNGREIELGAFLSPDERVRLHGELAAALGAIARGPGRP
jgi:uncharacterized membrane protein